MIILLPRPLSAQPLSALGVRDDDVLARKLHGSQGEPPLFPPLFQCFIDHWSIQLDQR